MIKDPFNIQIGLKWIEAFNEHDLEKLLGLYAENATHYSPKLKARIPSTNGWVSGISALRSWWADAFARIPSLQYELNKLLADEHRVLIEYTRKAAGEPDLMIAEVLDLENGLIIQSKVYHG